MQEGQHSKLTIGLLQIDSEGFDQDANLRKGELYCRLAAKMGADIALLPELWNIGYGTFDSTKKGAKEAWQARAIGLDSEFVQHFQTLAAELQMGIVVGFLESYIPRPRNTAILISPTGEILLSYSKVHTCAFDPMEASCTPGDEFKVADYPFGNGQIKIGLMICFDREFPESARVLMLKGAELILTPNACSLNHQRLDQFKTRAFENLLGVALANYPAKAFNGHSCAYNEQGDLLVMAGEEEGVYLAYFDIEQCRKHRSKEVFGDAYRRPSVYTDLVNPEAKEPFIRKDAYNNPLKR